MVRGEHESKVDFDCCTLSITSPGARRLSSTSPFAERVLPFRRGSDAHDGPHCRPTSSPRRRGRRSEGQRLPPQATAQLVPSCRRSTPARCATRACSRRLRTCRASTRTRASARAPCHVRRNNRGTRAGTRGPRAERGRRAAVRCDDRPSSSRVPARAARCAYPAVACAWPATGEQGSTVMAAFRLGERCSACVVATAAPPASELAGTRPRPVPIRLCGVVMIGRRASCSCSRARARVVGLA